MSKGILGIHHVTAICGDPQRNLDFYVGVLGLRMVKLTVNYDDPETYHLYYADGTGSPGSVMTFFPWPSAPNGRIGTGQVVVTSFSVPETSLTYWRERLAERAIAFREVQSDYGELAIEFDDPDGIGLQLVAVKSDNRTPWAGGTVPKEHAIRGFHGVLLSLEAYERTAGIMANSLGFVKIGEHGTRFRFASTAEAISGSIVDIVCEPDVRLGSTGVGTVHHVAFRAADQKNQLELRDNVIRAGINITPVIDRNYFQSVYFREPGHVLFELATDQPGFTIDEPLESLGTKLVLPQKYESLREQLVEHLPKLNLPSQK